MRSLYLVRHASPRVDPQTAAREWALSAEGVEDARALGERARAWGLAALYSSTEAKAAATARVIGEATGLPAHIVEGAHELALGDWIGNADQFNNIVREVLETPGESVPRAESAAAAVARFEGAMRIVEEGAFPAAIVTHGRLLAAYLGQRWGVEDAFELWRSIPMPGWTRIDLDEPRGAVEPFRA